jgi:hypothetical protein
MCKGIYRFQIDVSVNYVELFKLFTVFLTVKLTHLFLGVFILSGHVQYWIKPVLHI